MDANGVRELLKIKLADAGFQTNMQAAWKIGISDSHLSHVISGKDRPGPKLLKWLGLKRTYVYEFEGLNRAVLNSDDKPRRLLE